MPKHCPMVSDKADNYNSSKMYNLPDIKTGERIDSEADETYNGNDFVTIVRPTGYGVSLKSF